MAAWLKAVHIIGLILWMGGLFQLARHLGAHAELESDAAREAFADWESKTYYMTVLPGFILSLGSGLYALITAGFGHYLNADGAWGSTFHLKFLMLAILIGVDQVVRYKMTQLHDEGEGNRGLFMAMHGVVGLFFIIIVFIMTTKVLV